MHGQKGTRSQVTSDKMKLAPLCPVARLIAMSSPITNKGQTVITWFSAQARLDGGPVPATPRLAAPTALLKTKLSLQCGNNGHLIPGTCVRIQSHNPVPCTEINF